MPTRMSTAASAKEGRPRRCVTACVGSTADSLAAAEEAAAFLFALLLLLLLSLFGVPPPAYLPVVL